MWAISDLNGEVITRKDDIAKDPWRRSPLELLLRIKYLENFDITPQKTPKTEP